jgi:hypothetical protein
MTKKLIIPKESFAEMSTASPEYQIRFRLISDDRNRYSAWTPIYSVDPGVTFTATGTAHIEKHNDYTLLVWSPVLVEKEVEGTTTMSAELPHYDLWVRWGTTDYAGVNDGTWVYSGRIPATSVNLIKPSSPSGINHVSIEIYRPGRPVERSSTNGFLMYSIYNYSPI